MAAMATASTCRTTKARRRSATTSSSTSSPRAFMPIGMNARGELVEDDVVADRLRAFVVLHVDAVAMAAIAGLKAVVVDDISVRLAVDCLLPDADPLPRVVNHQVDELRPRRPRIDRIEQDRAREVGIRSGGSGAVGNAAGNLEPPEPGEGAELGVGRAVTASDLQ